MNFNAGSAGCGVVVLAVVVTASFAQSPESAGEGAGVATAVEVASAPEPSPTTSCAGCHGDAELFEPEEVEIVEHFAAGIHAEVGVLCHDCHGGNPDPALAEDYLGAMDENFRDNPYRGAPDPTDQPAMCGGCHSDADYMRRFAPAERVDQETEYWTSRHGIALAAGDENVARCSSCHGVHGILAADDPESPVYPTQVASTCNKCHGDAERMAGYMRDDGRPVSTNQYALWRSSVHGAALNEREDLGAPTCNDCHGNHGASPPGGDAVSYVCGQCHGREALLFRQSPKHRGFLDHSEYLQDAGDEGCAACHESGEPQALLTDTRELPECATCHGNHDVIRPTVAMLSPLPETPCALCHEGPGAVVDEVHHLGDADSHYEQLRDTLLENAASLGLDGDECFDWLVARASLLLPHTVPAADGGVAPRPEFVRLFEKFRIGPTSFVVVDPITGETHRRRIVRCSNCHAPEQVIGEEYAIGHRVAGAMLGKMRELTTTVAHAERVVLEARRGGVQTRQAQEAIDLAVDARIALDGLLHTFDAGGDFSARHKEGMEQAQAALVAGQQALEEHDARHRGLYWALVVIALFLLALGLKIRDLSLRPEEIDPVQPSGSA